MAVQAASAEHQAAINANIGAVIGRWDRRLRVAQTLVWLPRCLLPALIIGVVAAVWAHFRAGLNAPTIALLAIGIALGGLAVLIGFVWLRPRPPLRAARQFDSLFGLQERLSTALELLEGKIQTNDQLTSYQLRDTLAQLESADPQAAIPLRVHWREWIATAILLAGLVALLLLLPTGGAVVGNGNAATEAAVEAAADEVRDVTSQLAASPALEDEAREPVLQELETSLDRLEDENVTPEEALATLNEAQETLEGEAEALEQQNAQQTDALESANQSLAAAQQTAPDETAPAAGTDGENEAENSGDANQSEAGESEESNESAESQAADSQTPENAGQAAEEAAQTLEDLAARVLEMSQEEANAAADRLDQAADALEETNPEAANALRDAADALRNGQLTEAQEAMEVASDALSQQAQEMQRRAEGAQQLRDAAKQLGEAANSIARAGQPDNGQQSDGQPQEGQPGSQSGDMSSDSAGQQSGSQPGSQPGNQAGDQSGSQPGQGQPGQGNQGAQSSGEGPSSGSSSSGSPANDGGAGDEAGDQSGDTSGFEASTGANTNNNPDGEGEGTFDEVYAPRRLGEQPGGTDVIIEGDESNVPVQEGEFAENPEGDVTVPYNEVYRDYANDVDRALEGDYVPPGYRGVVRDYFSSLEPGE